MWLNENYTLEGAADRCGQDLASFRCVSVFEKVPVPVPKNFRFGPWFKITTSITKSPQVAEQCDIYVNIHSLIQSRHLQERLRWCKEHFGWIQQQWSRGEFSDESPFTVTSDFDYQFVRRERGTHYTAQNVQECHQQGPGVMVWAGIMHNVKTPYHIFEELPSFLRYCRKIFLVMFVFFRCGRSRLLFRDDIARLLRIAEVLDIPKNESIKHMT
ncbi:hypothetical protein TNCV_2966751 [Trichonephila clavipes]|nr:hypothetical protein TNCV_2966751 [Trichonephila clavipes]